MVYWNDEYIEVPVGFIIAKKSTLRAIAEAGASSSAVEVGYARKGSFDVLAFGATDLLEWAVEEQARQRAAKRGA